jgi:hypothetical protein
MAVFGTGGAEAYLAVMQNISFVRNILFSILKKETGIEN